MFKKALNNWLSYNVLNGKLWVNIRDKLDTPRIYDEGVPNNRPMDRIFSTATLSERVSIVLIAFAS